ncbi:MAG: PepSY domain-containing protein [Anaerohalosphaeraceae bacterium]
MQENEKGRKSIHYYMRAMHRDIGFFAIGLVLIYSLSGILLVYRGSDFLQFDKTIEKTLSPNLAGAGLGEAMSQAFHTRMTNATKTEGDIVYFQNGTYNTATGAAACTIRDYPFPLNKFISLHKVSGSSPAHWFVTLFGLLFIFLAISSFWMYNKKTSHFRRGLLIAAAGIAVSIILLMIS